MDEMYGFHNSTGDDDYSERAYISSDHFIIPAVDYLQYHNYDSLIPSVDDRNIPVFGSDELGFHDCSRVAPESTNSFINQNNNQRDGDEDNHHVIKAKIASHPSYPKLLDAYIDCQKVGAPMEIASLLDEIRREKDLCKYQESVPMYLGVDPELDEFMETYYDLLVKYKSDLSRPFEEATSFINKIETQLGNLCKDTGWKGTLSLISVFGGE